MNDSPRLSKNEVILRSFELFSILLPQMAEAIGTTGRVSNAIGYRHDRSGLQRDRL